MANLIQSIGVGNIMKYQKTLVSLALAFGVVSSGVAQASTTYLTNPNTPINYGALTSMATADAYEIDLTATNFQIDNIFNFSIVNNSTVEAYADNYFTQVIKVIPIRSGRTTTNITTITNTKDISGLAISLFNTNGSSISAVNVDGSYALSNGNYFAKVTGITTGTEGGTYSVVMSAEPVLVSTPAAVPVPAAAWLLGSGLLGLVGVSRRKQ